MSKIYGVSKCFFFSNKCFEFVSSDIFGPIKLRHFKTDEKFEYFYIATYTDIYSRFTEVFKIFDITTRTVVLRTFQKWCGKYGFPKTFLSDQGRQYISSEFKRYLNENNITHKLTSAYNPSCNGISKRKNSMIGTICRISRFNPKQTN